MMKPTLTLLLGALAFGLAACSDTGEEASATSGTAPENPELQAVMLDSEPENAVSVTESRKAPEPGTEVTVTGQIGGAVEPFTDGYAALVLADHSLEMCNAREGDGCATPWDACCETPEIIKASRLTIQVTDESGKPVDASLKGVNGLKELDEVVVTGKVAEGSTEENMIINASGIFRKTS